MGEGAPGVLGVLRVMGPTPADGEATAVVSTGGMGGNPLPSLMGTMTNTVSTRPQQKATSEPASIPAIVMVSLDFTIYLRKPAADTRAAPIMTTSRTARSTQRKTIGKLIAGCGLSSLRSGDPVASCRPAVGRLGIISREDLIGTGGVSLRATTLD